MHVTPDQIRAARALLRLEQAELAKRAGVSVVTIRRLESTTGHEQATPVTFDSIRQALEQAGVEFIPNGVRRRRSRCPDADALFEDLRDISLRSAERLKRHERLTEADLHDEDDLPA